MDEFDFLYKRALLLSTKEQKFLMVEPKAEQIVSSQSFSTVSSTIAHLRLGLVTADQYPQELINEILLYLNFDHICILFSLSKYWESWDNELFWSNYIKNLSQLHKNFRDQDYWFKNLHKSLRSKDVAKMYSLGNPVLLNTDRTLEGKDNYFLGYLKPKITISELFKVICQYQHQAKRNPDDFYWPDDTTRIQIELIKDDKILKYELCWEYSCEYPIVFDLDEEDDDDFSIDDFSPLYAWILTETHSITKMFFLQ